MHVGIIGGGISGLSAALLLKREGHQVTLFEAFNRLGGRIYTHHFRNDADGSDVYFEAGAMRIPRSALHDLVYALIRYLNAHNPPEKKVNLIPYVLEHKNNKTFIDGKRLAADDASWGEALNVPARFRGKSARALLGEVVSPWLRLLKTDFETGFRAILEYDEYSFRHYLRAVEKWPHEVIEYVELLNSQTNQYDLSFTELIMQNLDFDTRFWCTVRGGMSNIIDAAANLVGWDNIHLSSPVRHVAERADGRIELQTIGPKVHDFDKALLAIPTAALHTILQRPKWSFMKEQSLRGAHFEPLYKIGLHFRTRFWEHISEPCLGGQSTTDLRFRWIVYPSDHLRGKNSGVLLLYCWMSDALKWTALSSDERIELCLHDLAAFFVDDKVDVRDQFIEAFDVNWSSEFCGGDAMFLPGQFSRFHNVAGMPEGNIHFAGEHLSKHHTWISGALDSTLTSVKQIVGADLPALGYEYAAKTAGTPKRTKFSKRTQGPQNLRHETLHSVQGLDTVLEESMMASLHERYAIPKHLNVQYVEAV